MTQLDPKVPPTHFDQGLYDLGKSGGLRVGYLESLPSVPVGDAVRRVMREARTALEGMGHKVGEIQITTDQVMEARRLYLGLVINYFMGPSLEELRKNYEEPISSYLFIERYFNSPYFFRPYVLLKLWLSGERRSYQRLSQIRRYTKGELDRLVYELAQFQSELYQTIFSEFDVVVAPDYHHCAFTHTLHHTLDGLLDYQVLWSLL